ncbi:MAG: hypothetical protein AAB587_01155 [Patescibacteria group bacterium]
MRRRTIIFLTLFLMALPVGAFVEVENNVSATANTGGNSASGGNGSSGGTVVTPEATATVKIKTIIGGVVVEDINETYKGSAPLKVEKTSSYSTTSASVKTRVSVKAQATSSTATTSRVGKSSVWGVTGKEQLGTTTATSSQEQMKKAVQERKYYFLSRIKQFFKNVFSGFTF